MKHMYSPIVRARSTGGEPYMSIIAVKVESKYALPSSVDSHRSRFGVVLVGTGQLRVVQVFDQLHVSACVSGNHLRR
jgi:hypothetical protein